METETSAAALPQAVRGHASHWHLFLFSLCSNITVLETQVTDSRPVAEWLQYLLGQQVWGLNPGLIICLE